MRERLIELICKFKRVCNLSCSGLDKSCTRCMKEQLADYLLANGVIVPPMKLGQICFSPCDWRNAVDECRVSSIIQKANGSFKIGITNLHYRSASMYAVSDFGKTVFLTKEEAENALKGGNDVKCIDCEYLMFSDCYGECSKAYKGIVSPNDSCGNGVPKKARERE